MTASRIKKQPRSKSIPEKKLKNRVFPINLRLNYRKLNLSLSVVFLTFFNVWLSEHFAENCSSCLTLFSLLTEHPIFLATVAVCCQRLKIMSKYTPAVWFWYRWKQNQSDIKELKKSLFTFKNFEEFIFVWWSSTSIYNHWEIADEDAVYPDAQDFYNVRDMVTVSFQNQLECHSLPFLVVVSFTCESTEFRNRLLA